VQSYNNDQYAYNSNIYGISNDNNRLALTIMTELVTLNAVEVLCPLVHRFRTVKNFQIFFHVDKSTSILY